MAKPNSQELGIEEFIAMIAEIEEAHGDSDGRDIRPETANIVYGVLKAPRTAGVQLGFERALSAYLAVVAEGAVPDIDVIHKELVALASRDEKRSASTDPTHNSPTSEPIDDFHARALRLVTMFNAVNRLCRSRGDANRDDEAIIVTEQGARMAQELTDDIEQFDIARSHQGGEHG